MGVEFAHLLIPRDNTVRPEPDRLVALAASWLDNGYVVQAQSPPHLAMAYRPGEDPDSLVRWGFSMVTGYRQFVEVDGPVPAGAIQRLSGAEYLLNWSCEQSGGSPPVFPLNFHPPSHAYYDLQMLAAEDFIHMAGERLDPLDPTCPCGKSLAYDPEMDADAFYASRIRRFCPRCGQAFRPQDQSVVYRHPFTGEERHLQGGACFRFAIRLDAGKGLNPLPHIDGDPPRASPEFLRLCEEVLETELYEVGYFY